MLYSRCNEILFLNQQGHHNRMRENKSWVTKLVAGVKVRSSPVFCWEKPLQSALMLLCCFKRLTHICHLSIFIASSAITFSLARLLTHACFYIWLPLSHLLFLSYFSPAPTSFSCPRVCWMLALRRAIRLCVGPGYAMRSPTPGLVWLLEPKTGLRNGSARASPPTSRT